MHHRAPASAGRVIARVADEPGQRTRDGQAREEGRDLLGCGGLNREKPSNVEIARDEVVAPQPLHEGFLLLPVADASGGPRPASVRAVPPARRTGSASPRNRQQATASGSRTLSRPWRATLSAAWPAAIFSTAAHRSRTSGRGSWSRWASSSCCWPHLTSTVRHEASSPSSSAWGSGFMRKLPILVVKVH